MSTNNKVNASGYLAYDSRGRAVEPVGVASNRFVGVEIIPSDMGGWDVVACEFDDTPYVNEWLSIGNAEEVNNFATKEEARMRGLQIIEEELGELRS